MVLERYFDTKIGEGENLTPQVTNDSQEDNRVYKIQTADSRQLALKVMPSERRGGDDFGSSFELKFYQSFASNELGSETDTHLILPIAYSENENTGEVYLVMPFMEGMPFSQLIKERSQFAKPEEPLFPQSFVLNFARGIGIARQHLRDRHVIHGDIEDVHYWVANGEASLYDFEDVSKIQTDNDRYFASSENLHYFEIVGRYLLSSEVTQRCRVKSGLLDTYQINLKAEGQSRIPETMRKTESNLIAELGITGDVIFLECKAVFEEYGLNSLGLGFDFEEITGLLVIICELRKKYGDELSRFFAESIKSCLTDPQWRFESFYTQLPEMLK